MSAGWKLSIETKLLQISSAWNDYEDSDALTLNITTDEAIQDFECDDLIERGYKIKFLIVVFGARARLPHVMVNFSRSCARTKMRAITVYFLLEF